MNRAEIIKLLQKLPDHFSVSGQITRGINVDEKGGFTDATPNVGMTLVVEIAGGARDTRTQSGMYPEMGKRED